MTSPDSGIGRRVVVTGLAGSGKSTLSRQLAAKSGLPVIHLDVHFWKLGWVAPSEDEWREKQRGLLAGDAWIADGNYHATLDLRLERADRSPRANARSSRNGASTRAFTYSDRSGPPGSSSTRWSSSPRTPTASDAPL